MCAELRGRRRRRRRGRRLRNSDGGPRHAAGRPGRDYVAKYREHIARIGMTPETFAQAYEVPVRIQLTRVRGH